MASASSTWPVYERPVGLMRVDSATSSVQTARISDGAWASPSRTRLT